MDLTNKRLKKTLKLLDEKIAKYKKGTPKKKRDWRTYEQQIIVRLETAFDELRPLVYDAVSTIEVIRYETRGSKPKLSLEQKVLIILLKHIFGKSNRTMSAMFVLFSWLTGIKVSYKTVERLYSDDLVLVALNNLHKLIIDRKELEEADTSGDGTGYSLNIKKHYASYAQRLKDKAKEQPKKSGKKKRHLKKQFLYSFALMDIKTRIYIGYGCSFRSEQEAYKEAMSMVKQSGVKVKSIRLDKYYSKQIFSKELTEHFKGIKCYFIPKSNATIKGSQSWKKMLTDFIKDTYQYLKQYYKRNQSESGFSEDKKRTGWQLGQKRYDRIHTANILTYVWHNLYWLAD
jgi:transposase